MLAKQAAIARPLGQHWSFGQRMVHPVTPAHVSPAPIAAAPTPAAPIAAGAAPIATAPPVAAPIAAAPPVATPIAAAPPVAAPITAAPPVAAPIAAGAAPIAAAPPAAAPIATGAAPVAGVAAVAPIAAGAAAGSTGAAAAGAGAGAGAAGAAAGRAAVARPLGQHWTFGQQLVSPVVPPLAAPGSPFPIIPVVAICVIITILATCATVVLALIPIYLQHRDVTATCMSEAIPATFYLADSSLSLGLLSSDDSNLLQAKINDNLANETIFDRCEVLVHQGQVTLCPSRQSLLTSRRKRHSQHSRSKRQSIASCDNQFINGTLVLDCGCTCVGFCLRRKVQQLKDLLQTPLFGLAFTLTSSSNSTSTETTSTGATSANSTTMATATSTTTQATTSSMIIPVTPNVIG